MVRFQSPVEPEAASWNGNTLPLCREQPDGTVQVMHVACNKLIRDQVLRIIGADRSQRVTRVLDESGYEAALRIKLLEEASEAQAAPDGNLLPELADVLEVLLALARAHDVGWKTL